jgi:phenylalanyl-tRNA synthetase beta subunit
MDDAVGIKNAFNESYTHMRRSLAVRLFENIANNVKHGTTLKFFEIGKVYSKDGSNSVLMTEFLDNIDKKPFSEKKMLA